MNLMIRFLLAFFSVLVAEIKAGTAQLHIRHDNLFGQDAEIGSEWPYRYDDDLLSAYAYNPTRLSFIKFNLAGIPAKLPLKNAYLGLYCNGLDGSDNPWITLYFCNKPWAEKTISWSKQPKKTIHQYYRTAVGWNGWDITNLAIVWLQRKVPNYGLAVSTPIWEFDMRVAFLSSNYSNQWYRPELVLHFEMPDLIFPLRGGRNGATISGYRYGDHWLGLYDKFGVYPLLHTGVDYQAAAGDEVRVIYDGTVKSVISAGEGFGMMVTVLHKFDVYQFTSTYTHVTTSLKAGRKVYAGEVIGTIADLADEYGDHLHFQARFGPYSAVLSTVGRLPSNRSHTLTLAGKQRSNDPAFPDKFFNPEELPWQN